MADNNGLSCAGLGHSFCCIRGNDILLGIDFWNRQQDRDCLVEKIEIDLRRRTTCLTQQAVGSSLPVGLTNNCWKKVRFLSAHLFWSYAPKILVIWYVSGQVSSDGGSLSLVAFLGTRKAAKHGRLEKAMVRRYNDTPTWLAMAKLRRV